MLVAGVDSSTQACKVVVCDTDTGADVREGRAQRPPGTEVDPYAWEHALHTAVARAGGLDDVAALSVGGQQHGMVCLSGDGGSYGRRCCGTTPAPRPPHATRSPSSA